MTKREIRTCEDDIRWNLDGVSLKKVLEVVKNRIERYGEDATLDISGEDVEIEIFVKRLETDEEYARRLALEQGFQTFRDKQDRAEYERLKAKFGE